MSETFVPDQDTILSRPPQAEIHCVFRKFACTAGQRDWVVGGARVPSIEASKWEWFSYTIGMETNRHDKFG
jgi:hypothetical protein